MEDRVLTPKWIQSESNNLHPFPTLRECDWIPSRVGPKVSLATKWDKPSLLVGKPGQ